MVDARAFFTILLLMTNKTKMIGIDLANLSLLEVRMFYITPRSARFPKLESSIVIVNGRRVWLRLCSVC